MTDFDMHRPQIDSGIFATHDVACPVCSERKAILDLSRCVFQQCDECAREGWRLSKKRGWHR